MKKTVKILISLTALVTCFCLASCSFSFFGKFHSSLSGGTQRSQNISYGYTDAEYEKLLLNMSVADDFIKNGAARQTFFNVMNKIKDGYYGIALSYEAAYINYCMYGKTEDLDAYRDYYSKFIDVLKWYDNAYHALMDSPLRKDFYGDMTDSEILAVIGEEKSDAYYELTKRIKDMQAQFADLSDEEVQSQAYEFYSEFVNTANELAREEGYENFLYYAYENEYARDYSPADTDEFFNNVKTYVLPALVACANDDYNPITALSYDDYVTYNNFLAYNGFTQFMNVFDDYAYDMGGDFYQAYAYLWSGRGHYYISAEEGGFQVAFTGYFVDSGEPYVYFGPRYRDILTMVHEFAHYFVYTQSISQACMDLSETQSQADEFMFMRYMFDNYDLSEEVIVAIEREQLSHAYLYIAISALVNEFEKLAFSIDNATAQDIAQAESKIISSVGEDKLNECGIPFKTYWRMVCVQSPAYYISYATSVLNCLELYNLSATDYNAAKSNYLKLCIYDYDNMDYSDVLNYAGLSDPLDGNTFRV